MIHLFKITSICILVIIHQYFVIANHTGVIFKLLNNRRFQTNVISSAIVRTARNCALRCLKTADCEAANIIAVSDWFLCELHNSAISRLNDLEVDVTSQYMYPRRQVASSTSASSGINCENLRNVKLSQLSCPNHAYYSTQCDHVIL